MAVAGGEGEGDGVSTEDLNSARQHVELAEDEHKHQNRTDLVKVTHTVEHAAVSQAYALIHIGEQLERIADRLSEVNWEGRSL